MSVHEPAAAMVKDFTVIVSISYKFKFLSQSQETCSRTTPDFLAYSRVIRQSRLFCQGPSSEQEMRYHFQGCLYWLGGRRTHETLRGIQGSTMNIARLRRRMAQRPRGMEANVRKERDEQDMKFWRDVEERPQGYRG